MLGSNYKLFIFKLSMFEKNDEEIEAGETTLSKRELIDAIESEDAVGMIAVELAKDSGAPVDAIKSQTLDEFGSDTKYKGLLFGLLLQDGMQNDPLFIFKQYSSGNIVIYPETITFKLIKALPFSLIEGVAEKVIGNIKG